MAKISTYPIVGSPNLSDILIGSDSADNNNTKNFSIGSMLALVNDPSILTGFVPYTGAANNVDLGSNNLTANSAVIDNNLTANSAVIDNNLTANSAVIDNGFQVLAGLSEFNGPMQAVNSLTLDAQLIDGLGSPGTAGQMLTTNGSGTFWSNPYTPTLEEVLTAGALSTVPMTLNTLTSSVINLLTIPRVGINQVAFSDSLGILDGVSNFTYTASTSTLSVTNISATTIGSNDVNVDNNLSLQGPLLDVDGLPGTSGQVLKSTGSGVLWDSSVYVPSLITVLNAESTLTGQAPAAVDTPLQIRFDGPASNAYVTLSTLGVITFLQTGVYSVNIQGLFKRLGSSGGTAKVHFRGLFNGMPVGPTQAVDLDVVGVGIPYERSILLEITTAGSTLTFEVVRDSAGANAGGLYQELTTLPSWGDVPSAAILINKIV
jgi:hypothetical protein